MKFPALMLIGAASVLATGVAFARGGYERLPDDQPVTIDGVHMACTGVGDEAKENPEWRNYSVRLEFAGGEQQYLADLDVSLERMNGDQLISVRCGGPWLLVDLDPGKYRLRAVYGRDLTKTVVITAPDHGQKRIVVSFPEVVGRDE